MALRPPQDPYAAAAALIDKRIGSAFTQVHQVADALPEIRYIVKNMEAIVTLAGQPQEIEADIAAEEAARIAADALKANIASPTLTGTPLAPTAATGTNTTQIATTEFMRASLVSLGLYTNPTPVRMWSGGITSTGGKVIYDVAATNSADITNIGLVVSVNPDLSSPVFTATPVAPTVSSGMGGNYLSGKFSITGLTADTQYYYAATINGVVQTIAVGEFKTAPTNGVAKSFNFVIGCCTNSAYQLGNPYAPVAAMAPAFVVHCGDMDYSDIIVNDARAQRDRNTRTWRNSTGVRALNLKAPTIYMPDDHDFGPDDNHWDKLVSTRATHAQIGANTRLVVRETTPRYDDWNTNVLSQSWTWGRVRFILPDLRSQRRYVDGGPTFLGDGSDPPTGYDHKAAVFAAIDQAETDGMKMLVFISTSTWAPGIFDSWDQFNSSEQSELADKFRNSGVHVMLIHGDAHQGVIDDGTFTDRSSTQDGKLPLVCSSGWNWGAPFHQITDVVWNGDSGDVTGEDGNGTLFVKVEITDNGLNDIHWAVKFYGSPITSGVATLLGTYTDTDADVLVGFGSADPIQIETGLSASLAVKKSWFGPIPGCTVDYEWSSGPSGTLTFTPNRNTALIPRAYTTGVTDTVTISNPVRCGLDSIITRDVEWITLETELSAWLAEIDERPSDEQVFALNTFIDGLKAASIWSQLLKLYWLGAHTEESSKVNLIAPGTHTLTVEGSPSFTALLGWRGTNTTSAVLNALNTGYAIPSGNQNSMAASVRCLDSATAFNGEFGGEKYYINPRSSTASDFRTRNSSVTSNSLVTTAAAPGHFAISRTASGSYKKFVDGALVETVTQTSSTPDSTTMRFCGFYNATTPTLHQSGARRVAMGMISAGLSDADMLAYYNLETAFLQALGTVA